jgi:hypothetical protein
MSVTLGHATVRLARPTVEKNISMKLPTKVMTKLNYLEMTLKFKYLSRRN